MVASEEVVGGIAGSGPAVDAVRAALADVDVTLRTLPADELGAVALGFVVAPTGADTFATADAEATRWIAVEIGGVGGHALPAVDAAVSTLGTVGYADLRARVASTTDADGAVRGDRSAVRLAGAVAGRRAVATLSGTDLDGTVVEIRETTVGPERTLLPVPGSAPDRRPRREAVEHEADAATRAERAVDERTGIVVEVGERESFPAPYYVARTADTTAFADARAAELAAGVAVDWDAAFVKAVGEALERYAAGTYRAAWTTTAPARDRPNAVSPAEFPRPEGYRAPDPDEPIAWVAGERLATGERVSLPAEFVHYPPPTERHAPAITTGLGLGSDGVGALVSGLAEVIERDATMVSWYSTLDPLGLAVDDEAYGTLERRARGEGLSVTPLLVTTDVDVPVVGVAVHRDEWPRFAVGSDASPDPNAAARGALAEALQNWMELRALGPERAREEPGSVGRYADFPPAAREFVDVDSRVAAASVGPDDPPTGTARLDWLVERAVDAGLEPHATRLTTPDLEALGFEAVRVLVPEAQPLFTGEPFFAERAETVPRALGAEPTLDRPHHPYP